jgi:hypothetical protein
LREGPELVVFRQSTYVTSKIELATAFVQHKLSINIHVLKTGTHFIFLSALIACDS